MPDVSSRKLWVTYQLDEHCCAMSLPAGTPTYRTLLCVPISGRERRLGSLILYAHDKRLIQPEIRQWLTIAGGHLAVAIERARLFEAERTQRQHIAQLHDSLQEQVTRLERTQARLVQSEKLAAIGELVAGVAHELNNPLGSIVLYSQLLQRKGIEERFQRDLNRIVEQAHRASNIVQSLLDFARQRAPERKPVQINDVLRSSIDLVSYELSSCGIEIEMDLLPDLPLSSADPHQLQQVFVNLISNAYQAIVSDKERGKLVMRTTFGASIYMEQEAVTAPVIRVAITDDGPGISEEILSRIFDPFFTTKEPGHGTGLGLAVCHGIIGEHAGRIWAESCPGEYTTFFVELPAVSGLAHKESTSAAQWSTPATSASILIVDDDVAVQHSIAESLKAEGYRIDTAYNGEQALQRLEERMYDLILCETHLPDIDGRELYWQVYVATPEKVDRFIFITGDAETTSTLHFLEAVTAPWLVKPFEPHELLDIVRQRLAAVGS